MSDQASFGVFPASELEQRRKEIMAALEKGGVPIDILTGVVLVLLAQLWKEENGLEIGAMALHSDEKVH